MGTRYCHQLERIRSSRIKQYIKRSGWWLVRKKQRSQNFKCSAKFQAPFRIAVNVANPLSMIRLMKEFGQKQLHAGITSTLFMGSGFTHSLATSTLRNANIPQRLRIVAWSRSTPKAGKSTNGRWQKLILVPQAPYLELNIVLMALLSKEIHCVV
jgi:hypothetical protein